MQATEQPDVTGEVDVNPSLATERLDGFVDGLVRALPSLAIAAVLVVLAWLLGKLLKWGLVVTAVLFGATLVFPTLKVADLFAGLGVGSVAIGFAFKDILQNWMAGLLLLLRRPFEPGD